VYEYLCEYPIHPNYLSYNNNVQSTEYLMMNILTSVQQWKFRKTTCASNADFFALDSTLDSCTQRTNLIRSSFIMMK